MSISKCPAAAGDREPGPNRLPTNTVPLGGTRGNPDRLPTRRELLDEIEGLASLVEQLAAEQNRLAAQLADYVIADVGVTS